VDISEWIGIDVIKKKSQFNLVNIQINKTQRHTKIIVIVYFKKVSKL